MKKCSHVLLVEDNLDLAQLQAEMLKMQPEKYEIQTVHTGEQAKAALQKKMPDIILLDLTIPAPDGLALLRWMRRQTKEIPPVIVTTGCTDEMVQKEALNLGAKYFMIKPYGLKDLLGNIRMLLRTPEEQMQIEGMSVEKREYLLRAKIYLHQMTAHMESQGFQYALLALENYFDMGREGISMKALSEKTGHPLGQTSGNNPVEAALYRLVYQIWKNNSPVYQWLCDFCGISIGTRMPVRRFLTALGDAAKQENINFLKEVAHDK